MNVRIHTHTNNSDGFHTTSNSSIARQRTKKTRSVSKAGNNSSSNNTNNDDDVCLRNMMCIATPQQGGENNDTDNNRGTTCDEIINSAGVNAVTNPCGPSSFVASSPTRRFRHEQKRGQKKKKALEEYILETSSSGSSMPSRDATTTTGGSSGDGDDEEDQSNTNEEGDEPAYESNNNLCFLSNWNGRTTTTGGGGGGVNNEGLMFMVFVGDGAFLHPYSVFIDASDYIVERMILDHDHLGNFVDFSDHSVPRWKAAMEFIEPKCTSPGGGRPDLSWQVIPIVLPWFRELNSKTLLKSVDIFMLEQVIVARTGEDDCKFLTVKNLLLITYIAYRCRLSTTLAQSRQWLRKRIQEPTHAGHDSPEETDSRDVNELELLFELEDLQLLSTMMSEFEDLRDYLWQSSIIDYLPHDLNIQDSHGLVSNQLFPYLLREGMVQVSIIQQEERQNIMEPSTPKSVSSSTTTSTPIRSNHLTQDILYGFLMTTLKELDKFQKEKTVDEQNAKIPLSRRHSSSSRLYLDRLTTTRTATNKHKSYSPDDKKKDRQQTIGTKGDRHVSSRIEPIGSSLGGVFRPIVPSPSPRTFEC